MLCSRLTLQQRHTVRRRPTAVLNASFYTWLSWCCHAQLQLQGQLQCTLDTTSSAVHRGQLVQAARVHSMHTPLSAPNNTVPAVAGQAYWSLQ